MLTIQRLHACMHTVSKAETILHQPAVVVLSADHHPVLALLCNLHATLALASLPSSQGHPAFCPCLST